MSPNVKEIAQLIDQLRQLLAKAIALGEEAVHAQEDRLVSIVDERHRILHKTQQLSNSIRSQMSQLQLPAAEKAYLEERKALVFDLIPRIAQQTRIAQRELGQRLRVTKHDLAGFHRGAQAIQSYIKAPPARPWIIA